MAAEDDACDALFVIRAKGMKYGDGRLVLTGTDPNVTCFRDRPVRETGHLTMDSMKEIVTRGANDVMENPPTAAMSIFGSGGDVSDVVVELPSAPEVEADRMKFAVNVIDGEMPASGGPVALFADPIGMPLSPTSVAGAHRRHRRRAIRRRN